MVHSGWYLQIYLFFDIQDSIIRLGTVIVLFCVVSFSGRLTSKVPLATTVISDELVTTQN